MPLSRRWKTQFSLPTASRRVTGFLAGKAQALGRSAALAASFRASFASSTRLIPRPRPCPDGLGPAGQGPVQSSVIEGRNFWKARKPGVRLLDTVHLNCSSPPEEKLGCRLYLRRALQSSPSVCTAPRPKERQSTHSPPSLAPRPPASRFFRPRTEHGRRRICAWETRREEKILIIESAADELHCGRERGRNCPTDPVSTASCVRVGAQVVQVLRKIANSFQSPCRWPPV